MTFPATWYLEAERAWLRNELAQAEQQLTGDSARWRHVDDTPAPLPRRRRRARPQTITVRHEMPLDEWYRRRHARAAKPRVHGGGPITDLIIGTAKQRVQQGAASDVATAMESIFAENSDLYVGARKENLSPPDSVEQRNIESWAAIARLADAALADNAALLAMEDAVRFSALAQASLDRYERHKLEIRREGSGLMTCC